MRTLYLNVGKAMGIGNTTLDSMDGQTTADYTFKKDEAITMSSISSVKNECGAV